MFLYESLLYMGVIVMILLTIWALLKVIEKTCNKKNSIYDIIDDNSISSNDSISIEIYDSCPICLEPLNKNVVITNCTHKFHINCLKRLKLSKINNCPICRDEILTINSINSVLK